MLESITTVNGNVTTVRQYQVWIDAFIDASDRLNVLDHLKTFGRSGNLIAISVKEVGDGKTVASYSSRTGWHFNQ